LARTNYGFEKRQREMAKKAKKEEKRLKKAPDDAAAAGTEAGADTAQPVTDKPDDNTPS
jgi:hypothetical protein